MEGSDLLKWGWVESQGISEDPLENSNVLLSKIAPFWILMNDFCHLKEFKKKLHF